MAVCAYDNSCCAVIASMSNWTMTAQVFDDVNSMLPQANRIGLGGNTFNVDSFNETNWFMPLLQMAIALLFSGFIIASNVIGNFIHAKVQRLEEERFIQRGDVTGEYGRSTYGRTFEKLVWRCIKRHSSAERVGIIEKRETMCDWLNTTCRDFRTKKYWKTKFEQLLEISRAEHSILGIIWPVDDELVYFSRTQRLCCYYCGMLVMLFCYYRGMLAISFYYFRW